MATMSEVKTQVKIGAKIESLKCTYFIGNLLGITPWYDFSTQEFVRPCGNKLCCVSLGIVLVSLWIFGIIAIDVSYILVYQKLLVALKDVLPLISIEYLIIASAFSKRKQWKELLHKLHFIDTELQHYSRKCKAFKSCAKLAFSHVIFAVVYFNKLFIFLRLLGIKYFFTYGNNFVTMYYTLYLILLMSTILLMIRSKYRAINKLLSDILKYRTDSNIVVKKIRDVGKYYRYLGNTISTFNSIFGVTLCIMILHSIVDLLNCVNLILKSVINITFGWQVIVSCVGICLISMGSTIYILFCCDITSAEGVKIYKMCYELQDSYNLPTPIIDELIRLLTMTKIYEPRVNAAGFFVLERRTVLGIISIVTTYAIVLVQFRLSSAQNWNIVH